MTTKHKTQASGDTNCILIGRDAGINLADESNLFILACDGVEYLRADFSGENSVLQVKDYGESELKDNVLLAIQGWVEAQSDYDRNDDQEWEEIGEEMTNGMVY